MDGRNNFPKLHNAMWPGLVGKGPDSEPPIDLDTMLDLTAAAEVDGVKFDGVDLFLVRSAHRASTPPTTISKRLADKIAAKDLVVGSVVAPVWPPTGGGSAMGERERRAALRRHRSARPAASASKLRELGVRPYGVVRIDSAASVDDWAKDPEGNTKQIAETFREACDVAEDHGERLAAEGEICWGGMHSWRRDGRAARSRSDRPKTLGFQADMAHTLLYHARLQRARGRASCPKDFDWKEPEVARRGAEDADRRAAALDHRFPRRAERRHREWHRARTTRPAATAWPTIPTASSISCAHAGYWLRDDDRQAHAAVPAHLLGRLHVPERGDDEAADLERHSATS